MTAQEENQDSEIGGASGSQPQSVPHTQDFKELIIEKIREGGE